MVKNSENTKDAGHTLCAHGALEYFAFEFSVLSAVGAALHGSLDFVKTEF